MAIDRSDDVEPLPNAPVRNQQAVQPLCPLRLQPTIAQTCRQYASHLVRDRLLWRGKQGAIEPIEIRANHTAYKRRQELPRNVAPRPRRILELCVR